MPSHRYKKEMKILRISKGAVEVGTEEGKWELDKLRRQIRNSYKENKRK